MSEVTTLGRRILLRRWRNCSSPEDDGKRTRIWELVKEEVEACEESKAALRRRGGGESSWRNMSAKRDRERQLRAQMDLRRCKIVPFRYHRRGEVW